MLYGPAYLLLEHGDTYFNYILGEFTPKLEDVAVIARLSLFGDHNRMGIILGEEEEKSLQLLNSTLKVSSKSTYIPIFYGTGTLQRLRDAGCEQQQRLCCRTGFHNPSFLVARRRHKFLGFSNGNPPREGREACSGLHIPQVVVHEAGQMHQ